MANDQQVQVDHDEVKEWARRSDAIHDEFNEALSLIDEAVAEIIAEASKYTENGAPAPIYVNTVEQSKIAAGHLKEQIAKHQQNMKQDSESVLNYSEKVKEEAVESGARVASTDTHVTI
ncbi:hypothetical protein H7J87_11855 [Mycolicibacterium wolinskyi]|uniref:PE domain-containing protein n=1 Tax=Mycolicibacterium wolinskyi TaxID=59750 RepID=A0A1X2FJ36_9MYCO|nr:MULTISPECIES: hypothetical protein [Mycolicibacterium]MCV7286025.1 hypothetical protein [Mycolicibacterium wolinskyi]MCV7296221.1 hypothetical protein [Mycolicibacterium goodii]ORX18453.1 hypothetical protein AWC31_14210 [Mycolicibacterium wolinskyi]